MEATTTNTITTTDATPTMPTPNATFVPVVVPVMNGDNGSVAAVDSDENLKQEKDQKEKKVKKAKKEKKEKENNLDQEQDQPIPFVDLLFDVVLVEKATFMRSPKSDHTPPSSTSISASVSHEKLRFVRVEIQELAQAFGIARSTCEAFLEKYPNHGPTRTILESLNESDLETEENVVKYVRDHGGCNSAFKGLQDQHHHHLQDHHDHQDQPLHVLHPEGVPESAADTAIGAEALIGGEAQEKEVSSSAAAAAAAAGATPNDEAIIRIRLPVEDEILISEGYLVPVLDADDINDFEVVYGDAPAVYQDLIGRIVFSLRETLWNHPVVQVEYDRVDRQIVFKYGSRYFHMRSETRRKKREKELLLLGSSSSTSSSRGAADAAAAAARAGASQGLITPIPEYLHRLMSGLSISEAHDFDTYGLQGKLRLPLVEPSPGAYEKISVAMTTLYQKLLPGPDYISKRSTLIRKIQSILNSTFPGAELKVEVFGSYASGLGSQSSDADLCITTDFFQRSAAYNNMRTLGNMLRRGGMTRVQPITNARVPIVKFVDPYLKINCDINSGHVLGIHNSELIRCYTTIDERVRPFLYNLKAIVKKQSINDSSQGFLSSYAYVMMAIGFLQAQMKELRIQMNHEGRNGKDLIDCTFDHDVSRYKDFGKANVKSVGQLLTEFFRYYSRQFDYQTMEVNVRVGGGFQFRDDVKRQIAKGRPPQVGRGERQLVVMDPFIRDRNVAGSCQGRHLLQVWLIFEALYLLLSRGEYAKAHEAILIRDITQYNLQVALVRATTVEGPTVASAPVAKVEASSDPAPKAGRHRGRERKEREKEQEREKERQQEQKKEKEQRRQKEKERQLANALKKQKQKEQEQVKVKERRQQNPKESEQAVEHKKDVQDASSSVHFVQETTVVPAKLSSASATSSQEGAPSHRNPQQQVTAPVDTDGDNDTNDDADVDQENGAVNGESKSRKRRVRKAIAREYHNNIVQNVESNNAANIASESSYDAPVTADSSSSSTLSKDKSSKGQGQGSRPVTPVANGIEKEHHLEGRSSRRNDSKRNSSGSQNGALGNLSVKIDVDTTVPTVGTPAAEESRPKIKVMQSDLIKTLSEQKRHNDQLNQVQHLHQLNQVSNRSSNMPIQINNNHNNNNREVGTLHGLSEITDAQAAAATSATMAKPLEPLKESTVSTTATATTATTVVDRNVAPITSPAAFTVPTAPSAQKKPVNPFPVLGKTERLLLGKMMGGRSGGPRPNKNKNNNNNNGKGNKTVATMPVMTMKSVQALPVAENPLKKQLSSVLLKPIPANASSAPLKSVPTQTSNNPLKAQSQSQATATTTRGANVVV
ncbi:hypothetical protein BGZ83_011922 [Gryganskiella cystojenkinii]|nr:hypothetical protein BGZ83_011922 [Gryganskiella cystojenkinii]